LGDSAVGSGINFTLQVDQIRLRAFCFGMHFRIGRNRDIEIADVFQQLD
jgi:hypothetical protein